ncbi:MAG: hypothetical protein PHW82_04050 [Bacteroidales bacterium]|nr:hypothetical protein [Bacteroidales bacterium]
MKTKSLKDVVNSTSSSLFAVIVVIMAMFITVACEKDEIAVVNASMDKEPLAVLYSLKVDEDGIIVFKDFAEFNIVIDKLIELDKNERNQWENTIGFKSYMSYIESLLSEFDDIEFDYQIYEILSKYPEDFYLDHLPNEDSSVELLIPTTIYSYFSSSSGMYIIGDTIYRVGKEYVLKTNIEHKNDLMKEDLTSFGNDDNCSKYQSFRYKGEFRTKGCGGHEFLDQTVYDPSWCNNDRRLSLQINTAYVETGSYSYKVTATIKIWGNKKLSCIWVVYKTILNYKNIDCNITYAINGVGGTDSNDADFPDYNSSAEEYNYTRTDNVYNDGNTPLHFIDDYPEITSVSGQYKSRAFTTWSTINCN